MASTRVYSLCFLVCMLFLAHLTTGYKRSDDAEDIDEDYDYNDDQGRSLRQYFVEISCCMERNYDELCEGFRLHGITLCFLYHRNQYARSTVASQNPFITVRIS